MLTYMLYELFIIDGDNEMWEYFALCFWGIFSIILDLVLSPIEILAFILWKLRRNK